MVTVYTLITHCTYIVAWLIMHKWNVAKIRNEYITGNIARMLLVFCLTNDDQ